MIILTVINMIGGLFLFILIVGQLQTTIERQNMPEGRHVYREWHNGFYGDDTYRDTVVYVKHATPSKYRKEKTLYKVSALFTGIGVLLAFVSYILTFTSPLVSLASIIFSTLGFILYFKGISL